MADLHLGRLGYGAANIGNLYRALTDDEAWQILDTAWDSGIRYFDTAPHYGLGLSERRLGAFLATKPRDHFVLSTKAGRLLRPAPDGADHLDMENDFAVPADWRRVWDLSGDGVRRSLEESLQRMQLDSVDIVYLHDPERSNLRLGLDEGLPGLAGLRDEGLLRAVGVGSMDNKALVASARTGVPDLLMVAGRFTLADQSAAEEVFPICRDHNIGVIAAAVFNSGLLASDVPSADARFDYGPVPPELLERTRRIAAICGEYNVSLPAAALTYPLQHPLVQSVVVGGAKPEQVKQNAAGAETAVPSELWEQLRVLRLVAV